MSRIRMEKVVLSAGATGEDLDKAYKLLGRVSGEKVIKTISKKRIPTWGVRPNLEVGCKVTIRGKKAELLLKRLLAAIDNVVKKKQVAKNHFSFGIKEYIEIPDMEYQRDIGVMGFNTTVDFIRPGFRVKRRRAKKSKIPTRQEVSVEEIIKFLEEKYEVNIK